MKKIIRVFPQRTSYTPTDDYVFIGAPPALFIPPHDEVHVSCIFTWDKAYCESLKYQWEAFTDKPVLIGGPAYGSGCDSFTPGMYVKRGITFTSRGCNNICPWCLVPEREGPLCELPITPGNIIQDNNFLQCSRTHKEKVFDMLKIQRGICFKGGLQVDLIDSHFINAICGLRISELWLACDTDGDIPVFTDAATRLTKAGFNRNKIKCYALIYDDMEASEQRLQAIYKAGAMPFAQLYQPIGDERKEYSADWKKFQRMWSRPPAIIAHVIHGTDYRDYNTEVDIMKAIIRTVNRSELGEYLALRESAEILDVDGTEYYVESISYTLNSRYFTARLMEVVRFKDQ